MVQEINEQKLKIKPLHWETNPTLKEAAERLGVFEKNPDSGPLKSTDNSLANRSLQKLQKAGEKVVDVEADSNSLEIDVGVADKTQLRKIPPMRMRDE